MQDTELYQYILGLESPWKIAKVGLNVKAGEIVERVDHPQGTKFCCPECEQELACYDHVAPRRWRHLDSCQFKTMLEAAFPRVKCPEHGVKQANVPWFSPNSRFTLMFESFAIRLLQATQTVQGARLILGISWVPPGGSLSVRSSEARRENSPGHYRGSGSTRSHSRKGTATSR